VENSGDGIAESTLARFQLVLKNPLLYIGCGIEPIECMMQGPFQRRRFPGRPPMGIEHDR